MKKPIILFRKDITTQKEFEVAKKYFDVTENRTRCENNLVISRYSCLPYHYELEDDLKYNNCEMINTTDQHKWIADFDYYQEIKEYTFETWDQHEFPYSNYPGPWICKGKTNSMKHLFSTRMFAKDRCDAIKIMSELMKDDFIGPQGIIFRKYVPLKSNGEVGLSGIPFSNEWRFFFYRGKLLSYGYYWSMAENALNEVIDEEMVIFAQKIADIAKDFVNFYVIDVAEKESGGYIVVELNDGCMSGLSLNDPDELYGNLAKEIGL